LNLKEHEQFNVKEKQNWSKEMHIIKVKV